MKIAVVGAGIFGCTISTKLSKLHTVDLYESSSDIMTAASRTNQLRLHRGYHYPRSPDTVNSLLRSINFFKKEYTEAVIDKFEHFYCIAKEKSLVSPDQYINFCNRFNLEYEIIQNFSYVNLEKIALTVKVEESLLDYHRIYDICKKRIKDSSMNVKLNTKFKKEDCKNYDIVINCTYANINDILEEDSKKEYQFEVCEKIAVKMPHEVSNKSIVIMDGPFMCVDPYGNTGNSLLGNVVHAIHSSKVEKHPTISDEITPFLNKGIVKNPKVSNFNKFIEVGKNYIPSLEMAEYIGSMYTVRAVLPNMDKTDGRPTIVAKQHNNIINVFSGKIDTCVNATTEIIEIIGE